jgi:hypothetical protein
MSPVIAAQGQKEIRRAQRPLQVLRWGRVVFGLQFSGKLSSSLHLMEIVYVLF